MRILIVSQYFFPENFRINDLALGLVERGHDVTVLTGLPNYPNGEIPRGYSYLGPYSEKYHGVNVIRVPLITRGRHKGFRLILNYLSFALFGSLIGPLRCQGPYDAIFVWEISPITVGLPAIAIKLLTRAPIFFWVGDVWPDTLVSTGIIRSKFILELVSKLVRFIYRNCDTILLSTTGFIERVMAQRVPRQKLVIWEQWAEDFYARRNFSEGELPRAEMPGGFTVMFAGNLGISQALDVVLDAAEELKPVRDIHWVVLGDGSERGRLEQEIRRRGLEDTFHLMGSRPAESMPFYYYLADALLVSLKSDPLFSITMPGKLASYFASGKPVLGSIDGIPAQYIEQAQCGFAAPAGDGAALAQIVRRMYSLSPAERERLGENGYQFYQQRFTRAKLISDLEYILRGGNNHEREQGVAHLTVPASTP